MEQSTVGLTSASQLSDARLYEIRSLLQRLAASMPLLNAAFVHWLRLPEVRLPSTVPDADAGTVRSIESDGNVLVLLLEVVNERRGVKPTFSVARNSLTDALRA